MLVFCVPGYAVPVAVAELSLKSESAGMQLFLTEEEKEAREQAKEEARRKREWQKKLRRIECISV